MIIDLKIASGIALPAGASARSLFGKIPSGSVIQVEYKPVSTGSQSMLGTWWMWMGQTAEFMAANGCTMPLIIKPNGEFSGSRPFAKEDAHEYFTEKWLGSDEQGNRLSWSKDKSKPDRTIADEGQRHHALSMHDQYCTERAIKITIPIKSEYREIMERMNG